MNTRTVLILALIALIFAMSSNMDYQDSVLAHSEQVAQQ
jgi:hypothetical protein